MNIHVMQLVTGGKTWVRLNYVSSIEIDNFETNSSRYYLDPVLLNVDLRSKECTYTYYVPFVLSSTFIYLDKIIRFLKKA